MPLTSDLKIDVAKLDPKAVSEGTKKFNDGLIEVMKDIPKWWEVRYTL